MKGLIIELEELPLVLRHHYIVLYPLLPRDVLRTIEANLDHSAYSKTQEQLPRVAVTLLTVTE